MAAIERKSAETKSKPCSGKIHEFFCLITFMHDSLTARGTEEFATKAVNRNEW